MTIQQSISVASNAAPPASDAQPVEAARVTPMMEQYLEIKAANPGLLLFYRMGDFYELFFEDAEIAARTLGIVLTKRGKHQGMDIPMCGVPVERSDDYLHRLIAQGHRVAVCEQMEDPAAAKARGNKSVVRRGVVRLVTPGTLTEDNLLDARTNNYLLAIARARASSGGDRIGLAWIDISTAEFMVTECAVGELAATLARINPNEAIVTDALYGDADLGPLLRELPAVTPLTRDVFDGATAERRLCDYFAVATMDGLSAMSRLEATAAAAAVTYIDRTQVGKRPPLSPPSRDLARAFERALAEQLPLIQRDGGFVREQYEPALDETRSLRDASRLVVAAMQARYADDSGVKGLKIRHNNVLGYFVEVTAQHGDKLMAPPLNATFIHRQTLAGQVRFTTAELGEIEAKIASAGDRALGLELEIFERLSGLAIAASDDLRAAAHAFALLDVATALAKLAVDDNYVRPEVDASLVFAIEAGRHPVVEQALKRDGQPFIVRRLWSAAGVGGGGGGEVGSWDGGWAGGPDLSAEIEFAPGQRGPPGVSARTKGVRGEREAEDRAKTTRGKAHGRTPVTS